MIQQVERYHQKYQQSSDILVRILKSGGPFIGLRKAQYDLMIKELRGIKKLVWIIYLEQRKPLPFSRYLYSDYIDNDFFIMLKRRISEE